MAFDQPLDGSVPTAAMGRLIPFEEEESVIQQAKGKPQARRRAGESNRDTLTHKGTLRIAAARLG